MLGYAHAGVRPEVMGIGPVPAVQNLSCASTGLTVDRTFDVIESNEAFAAQASGCQSRSLGLDASKVNPNGGAIALGSSGWCATGAIVTLQGAL